MMEDALVKLFIEAGIAIVALIIAFFALKRGGDSLSIVAGALMSIVQLASAIEQNNENIVTALQESTVESKTSRDRMIVSVKGLTGTLQDHIKDLQDVKEAIEQSNQGIATQLADQAVKLDEIIRWLKRCAENGDNITNEPNSRSN